MRGELPHELLSRPPWQIATAVEWLRAARRYRLTEAKADLQQLAEGDEFGVGRVLALLLRQTVTG